MTIFDIWYRMYLNRIVQLDDDLKLVDKLNIFAFDASCGCLYMYMPICLAGERKHVTLCKHWSTPPCCTYHARNMAIFFFVHCLRIWIIYYSAEFQTRTCWQLRDIQINVKRGYVCGFSTVHIYTRIECVHRRRISAHRKFPWFSMKNRRFELKLQLSGTCLFM